MGVYKQTEEVEIRERRLSSITGFHGSLDELTEKSKHGSLCSSCSKYEQCGMCSQVASTLTLYVRDSVTISHAPIGCGLEGISYAQSGRVNAKGQDRQIHFLSSNIQEKDTIYGASVKLEDAIDEAVSRYDPKVIFILGSCVSGIIGEDLETLAAGKEAEHGISILPIYCEGFKSKVWTSGFDATYHAVLKRLVKKPDRRKPELVNIFNFIGADRLGGLLERAGLKANYVLPFATVDEVSDMSAAACSASFCDTLSSYVETVLDEEYGVKRLKSAPPFGLKWTDEWLREIGTYTGKETEIEKVIEEEHERIAPQLEKYRNILKGKRAFVVTGDTFAYQIANVLKDLGMEVSGIASLHHDQRLDGDEGLNSLDKYRRDWGGDVNAYVCVKQPYQLVKLLEDADPDVLICRHPGLESIAIQLGIPVVIEGDKDFGVAYEGIPNLARRIERSIRTKGFVKNIAEHSKLPYTDWWLDKETTPFYFENKKEA